MPMNARPGIRAIDEAQYERYLAALLAGERAGCARVVEELLGTGTGLKELYVHLLQRALYQTGELWESQRISVAVEHLATAITEHMLAVVQARTFGGPARGQSIIIACVADEFHQLGGRMIADFCEFCGWRGHFLGANTPLPDLLQLIETRRPALLGLSLSLYFNLSSLLDALAAVTLAYPALPVVVGGQAFRWGGLAAVRHYPNVTHIASLDELEQYLSDLLDNAVEHSPAGGTVTLSSQALPAEIRVQVADAGPGITPAQQQRLFVAFASGQTHKSTGERSIGLGLAIARKIVEAHGGRMFVESEAGRGSVFGFTLPLSHSYAIA